MSMASKLALTIIKATYSKQTTNDVTAKVKDLLAANGGSLILDKSVDFNKLFGDPEPGKDKLFHLVYSYGAGGAQRSMTHAEKHIDIYLPALEIKQGQVLTVNVIKAIGLRDTRTIGKQNPYAKLTCGSESFKTKVHEKGGVNADWNQSFIFNLDGKDQFMHVVVYDKETLSDDVIARFDIPLPTLAVAQGEVAYNLCNPSDFKKSAGSIVLKTEFRDPNAPVSVSAAAAPAPAPAPVSPQQATSPQVVYMQQPQQPQVVYQQPQVVYQQPQPQPVYQQPQVVYQQPQPVYQQPQPQPVYQQPQPVYSPPAAPAVVYQQPAASTDSALANCYNQRWTYDAKSGMIKGWDGRVLDVYGNDTSIGAKLSYGPAHGGANQQWDHVNGEFKTRMGTGYVIDTWGGPNSVKDGAELRLGPSNGGNHQKWDIDQHGFIRSRHNNTYVFDVVGGKSHGGMDDVKLYAAKAAVSQAPQEPAGLSNCYNQRWTYDAKSGMIKGWDGRALDVYGGDTSIGAKLSYGPAHGGPNQQWDHIDGEFKTRMGTGYVIDTWGGPNSVTDGAELRLGPSNGGNHQKWDIDQWGFIRSRHNNRYVFDVVGGKTHGGMDDVKLYAAKL